MALNIPPLLNKCQGNVFSGMRAFLGDQLGVSTEALERLGIGWAPVVTFKANKVNTQGWWVIPERSANGEPVGLGLRSNTGTKTMYPGSKHGLIFEVNPNHTKGSSSQRFTWKRIKESGVMCPICGKPDGCMVSSDNINDPQAAICIRESAGSIKAMDLGYLHHRRVQQSSTATLLRPSDKPVIIVEGMTDAAVAMDLGFVSVGRPSNLAGMDVLKDLVRGRPVMIIGENDDINPQTGKRPGHEGMIASYQVLRKVCPDAVMVRPPDQFKDLRQWATSTGLTAEQLMQQATEDGESLDELSVLPDDKMLTIARAWLDSEHRMAGRYVLRYYAGAWWKYTGSHYEPVDEDVDIRGKLYGWSYDKKVLRETPSGKQTISDIQCTAGLVNNIMDAMLTDCPVHAEQLPVWINNATGPSPMNLIPFENGILDYTAFIEGRPESEYLIDQSPDLFNTFALPFAFDPTAKCPNWLNWLDSSLGDELEKIEHLQEWFGYCLTPDTSLHKMMLLRGPTRSGKGTAISALMSIVGSAQYCSTSFASITGPFGLENLIGKQIAVIGDARLPHKSDSMLALELLLNIVGEDPVDVNRKFKKQVTQKLRCRFTLATNELPELPDHSGAMEQRLNIVDFKRSFAGREDFGLKDRHQDEVQGIVLWALEGLRRLRGRGRFTTPESSKDALREWRMATSPTAAFVAECCEQGEGYHVGKRELFDTWTAWSRERGMRPVARQKFQERIKTAAPFAVSRSEGTRSSYYGLQLKKWASIQYGTGR